MLKRDLANALKEYMTRGNLTQACAARLLGTSQPVVSRVLNGTWKRMTPKIREISETVGVTYKVDPRENSELMDALTAIWDGSEQDAKAIAKVIYAIGELRK